MSNRLSTLGTVQRIVVFLALLFSLVAGPFATVSAQQASSPQSSSEESHEEAGEENVAPTRRKHALPEDRAAIAAPRALLNTPPAIAALPSVAPAPHPAKLSVR